MVIFYKKWKKYNEIQLTKKQNGVKFSKNYKSSTLHSIVFRFSDGEYRMYWLFLFDGGCERGVVHRKNEGYRAWGALKSVLSNRGLGIKAKKRLYERVPMAYEAEAWGMRSAQRRKVNVLQKRCLRSLVVVS